MRTLLLTTLLPVLFLFSCKKDEAGIPPDGGLVPTRMEITNSYFEGSGPTSVVKTFQYDGQGKITSIATEAEYPYWNKPTGPVFLQFKEVKILSYDSQGNVVREDVEEEILKEDAAPERREYSNVFTYSEGRVTLNGEYAYVINSKGQVIEFLCVGEKAAHTTWDRYPYRYDKRGNCHSNHGSGCDFDSGNGVLRSIRMPVWYKITQLHLMPTPCQGIVNNQLGDSGSTFKYEYNNEGYPVTFSSSMRPGIVDGGVTRGKITYTRISGDDIE